MTDLFITAASMLSEREILDSLQRLTETYRESGKREDRQQLIAYCTMFMMKEMIDKDGVQEVRKAHEHINRVKNLFNIKPSN